MVGAWSDVDVGRKCIFFLAGATICEDMSVLSVCSVTLESRCLHRGLRFKTRRLQALGEGAL
jgi:hypothetical protein